MIKKLLWLTDGQTDRRTDIRTYIAELLSQLKSQVTTTHKLKYQWPEDPMLSESWEQHQSHQSSYLMLQHYYRAGRGPVNRSLQCTRSWSGPELIWAMLTFPSTHPNTHSLVTILTIVLPYTPSHTPMFWPLHLLGCCISNILCQLCVRS